MEIGRHGLALKVCLVVFHSNMYGCLVGEVTFSLEQLLMMRRDSVGFMIGLRCLVDVDCDLILCFLIWIVCCGAKACDIILRIF